MRAAETNSDPIDSAVFTFIGYKQTDRQTNKQTDKQADRQTNRHTNKQTPRQAKYIYRCILM